MRSLSMNAMPRREGADRRGLFLRRQVARPCRRRPSATPRPCGAGVPRLSNAHDDVAGLGKRAMEQHAVAAPAIGHRLPRRLAVDVHDDRDTCVTRSNDGGLSIQPSSDDASTDVHREELGRRLDDVGRVFAEAPTCRSAGGAIDAPAVRRRRWPAGGRTATRCGTRAAPPGARS